MSINFVVFNCTFGPAVQEREVVTMGTLVQITLVSIVKVLRVWKLLNHIMHKYNCYHGNTCSNYLSIANVFRVCKLILNQHQEKQLCS